MKDLTKLPIYGLVAVLSVIILAAFAYNFPFNMPQFQPFQPKQPQPQQPTQPDQPQQPVVQSFLQRFTSYEQLKNFLGNNSKTSGPVQVLSPLDVNVIDKNHLTWGNAAPTTADYSTTNIQVAGVDEADIVKTDGTHIFTVSGNTVFIAKAYPPEQASVVSSIHFANDTFPAGIFVEGDKLAVLGSKYQYYPVDYYATPRPMLMPFFADVKTFVQIYSLADITQPQLMRNFTITGSYFSSRMLGDYVYFVASQPAYIINDIVPLPKIYSNNVSRTFEPTEIYYSDAKDNYFTFTTVVALNMQNATEPPNPLTLMLGSTSNMYMSLNNMYITFPDYRGNTSIYRIRIQNRTLTTEAKGEVPGHELNQFCMDESGNYFRIATENWPNGTVQSNLYVLNMSLNTVGNLTGIEPGETMDSARFIGNRVYLSTSVVRKDPFFVIDLTNPVNPKILGYLKIPGFNRYLHPYDDNHIIGVGRDASSHVQLSLFDVTNVSAPVLMGNYTFPGDYSDTPVLSDHRAFLFDKSKDLLVIPVSITDYTVTAYKSSSFWQGVYVFNVNLSEGFVLKGTVTQGADVSYWNYSNYWVKRALYIDDVLYTVSDKRIQMNDLNNLAFINQLSLP